MKKRYGVIIEYKKGNEEQYHFKGIVYTLSLKKAKEYVKYADSYDGGLLKYRAFGIFDYEEAVYKYIVKED